MSNQVPDNRLSELTEQVRRLTEQNATLKGTVDAVMQRQNPQREPPKSIFAPEVQSAIDQAIESKLGQREGQFRNAYNNLYEQFDELKFKNDHKDVDYNTERGRIQALRDERQRMGQYLSRDEAYKFIAFEELQKKAKAQEPTKVNEPAKPVFDPYLNQYVTPEAPVEQPPVQVPNPPVQQQTNQQIPPVTPVVQNTQTDNNVINLPPQGKMTPSVPTEQTRNPIGLDLMSDAKTLEAFENKFGDVPL